VTPAMTSLWTLYESTWNDLFPAAAALPDANERAAMRSKYTKRERKTKLEVGQYLSILSRYASREIVGTFRAWKVRGALVVDVGARTVLAADVREKVGDVGDDDDSDAAMDTTGVLWSFDCAMWVRIFASSLSKSAVGYRSSVSIGH